MSPAIWGGFLLLLLSSSVGLATPRIALLGTHLDGGSPEQAAQILEPLQEGLRQSSRFSVISLETATRELIPRLPQVRDDLFLVPGRALLQEARIYAEQADFDKAIELLEQAEESLLFYREHLTSNQDLIEIQLALLQLHGALGHTEQVEARLIRILTLAPASVLDPRRTTPELQDRFQSLKRTLTQRGISIQVRSDRPDTAVFLNGNRVGTAPLELDSLPPGEHFIRLQDAVGRVYFQSLVLEKAGATPVQGRLERPSFFAAARDLPPTGQTVDPLYRAYRSLGAHLQADFVLLTSLEEAGLDLQLLQVETGGRSPIYHAPLPDHQGGWAQLVRTLVNQLESLISEAGTLTRTADYPLVSDPRTNPGLSRLLFADLPATVDEASRQAGSGRSGEGQEERRPPLLQRPLFWGIVGGVVLAGAGGAAAGLLLSGDGSTVGEVHIVLPTPP